MDFETNCAKKARIGDKKYEGGWIIGHDFHVNNTMEILEAGDTRI